MITFYIEAASLGELRLEVCRALSLIMPPDTTLVPANYPHERPHEGDNGPPARDPVPEAESKPRRKHRATRPPVAPSEAIKEQMQDVGQAFGGEEDEEEELGGGDDVGALQGLTPVSTPVLDSLGNEKVKAEVIGRLADLFTAGKVKVLRGLLDQYGDGAKSFPEIDAAKFPAIREALDRGIAA